MGSSVEDRETGRLRENDWEIKGLGCSMGDRGTRR